jgi:hypothetical protein
MALGAISDANPEANAGKLVPFQLAQICRDREGYTCDNISMPPKEPSRSDAHNLRRKDAQESLSIPLRQKSQQLSYAGHPFGFSFYATVVLHL